MKKQIKVLDDEYEYCSKVVEHMKALKRNLKDAHEKFMI